jgi:diguanylate cyclase (GGDEF)-like protein
LTHEDSLSAVLSEFARTLTTDFPIQRILDHLVDRIVDILPITSAGVTLISEGMSPRYIAASDESARRFERLQTEMDEGPCVRAYELGEAVSVPNLQTETRFPRFTPAAVAAGLGAVFTFPLHHDDLRFGALDLYREHPGDLDEQAMASAQTLADVAAAYLLNARSRDAALATSDQFQHDAMHDSLTGLPNRLLLQERLEHAASRAKRTKTCTAILFLDLDHFKQVNDTYGHTVGDQLLIAVAQRLTGLIRASDTLCRFSGDEFVFLCEEVHGASDVAMLARRIDDTFTTPFQLSGVEVTVRASVGTAYVGPGQDITADLLVRADKAMYRAKREADGRLAVTDLGDADPPTDDQSLEADLRTALDRDELEVAYQPIVRNADQTIVGIEALLRWTHRRRGVIAPTVMVPIAERSVLIVDVGAWILERACTDHARWTASQDGTELDLSVNVSVRQLMSPGYCETVANILARTEMNPELLILELTESIVIEHSASILAVLIALNSLGVRLALDDFGTGYSSLSHLSKLPIQIVKIDQGFITELESPSGRVVVSGITDIAHALGIEVVAEGVETATQRDETRAIGCDYSQGYFFARPMSADSFGSLLVGA